MKALNIGDLRIPVPIIQGGMGIGVSLSGLASAVANMGGIGVISTVGIGFTRKSSLSTKKNHIETLRQEIRNARKQTPGVLGVNIMTVLTNFSDMVKTSIEEGIDVIFSGAGLPLDLPKYLNRNHPTKLVPIVSSARAASIIIQKWKNNYDYLPDALVLEGPKAGGHLGFKSNEILSAKNNLETLLKEILEVTAAIKKKYQKEIPVIAAGGIFSGSDIFSIMKKGATAVQLGTRFVATKECDASVEFKNAFINANDKDIRIIKSPVGLPGRAIFNNFLNEAEKGNRRPLKCDYQCIRSCSYKSTLYCIADALVKAYEGKLLEGFAFTGVNAGKIKGLSSVKNVFNDLIKEFKQEQNKDA